MMADRSQAEAPPAVRIGVNGFGRIGRQAVRIMTKRPSQFKIMHINSTRERSSPFSSIARQLVVTAPSLATCD